MSVSRWAYDPDRCDGEYCCGNCHLCMRNTERDGDPDDCEKETE